MTDTRKGHKAIRLFCSDFDNTLAYRGKVPKSNVQAVRKLQAAGIEFALVTGRMYANAKDKLQAAGLEGHIIGTNGSYVSDQSGQVIDTSPLSEPSLHELMCRCGQAGWPYFIYTQKSAYFPRSAFRFPGARTLAAIVGWRMKMPMIWMPTGEDFFSQPDRAYKVNVFPKARHMEAARAAILSMEGVGITSSSKHHLEVMAVGVNKWTGIQALAKARGIDESEIAAIGDYENDIEMLQGAACGFAMGNAHFEVKQAADVCVGLAKEGGVREAIEYVLTGKGVER